MKISFLLYLPVAAAINRGGDYDAATIKATLSRRLKADMGGGGAPPGGGQPGGGQPGGGGGMAKGAVVSFAKKELNLKTWL